MAALPTGWSQHWDDQYSRYYFVDATGRSTWDDPRASRPDSILPLYTAAERPVQPAAADEEFSIRSIALRRDRADEALARRGQERADEELARELARLELKKGGGGVAAAAVDTAGDEALARRLAAEDAASAGETRRGAAAAVASRADADAALARRLAQEEADAAYARRVAGQQPQRTATAAPMASTAGRLGTYPGYASSSSAVNPHYQPVGAAPPPGPPPSQQPQVVYVQGQPAAAPQTIVIREGGPYYDPYYDPYYYDPYYYGGRRGYRGGLGVGPAFVGGAAVGAAGLLATEALLWGPGWGPGWGWGCGPGPFWW
ncbi:hypothetical protein HK405_004820 [Cladochytrium tenue]|nr:hypothetical protein HK405_004820 [Cladochytrium tenue]